MSETEKQPLGTLLVVTIMTICFHFVMKAWVLSLAWKWYVVPYNVPMLTMWQFLGIVSFTHILLGLPDYFRKPIINLKSVVYNILYDIYYAARLPLLLAFFLWVFKP